MTEAEWLACTDPAPMHKFLGLRLSARKKRLFACACCRRILHLIPDDRIWEVVAVNERFADGAATRRQLGQAYSIAWEVYEAAMSAAAAEEPYTEAVEMACGTTIDAVEVALACRIEDYYDEPTPEERRFTKRERIAQAELVREFVGNPFRPATLFSAWLAWNDGTVPKIAQGIYEERAFDRMPILADALLDAGCDNEELLAHCRSAGPHVRGCWALDLLLGKV